MEALDKQIGGQHYKGCLYQPVKFIVDLNLNFIQGNIIKYITRYKGKDGKQDLEKIIHYVQLGKELAPRNNFFLDKARQLIDSYALMNNLDRNIRTIVVGAVYQDWRFVELYTNRLISEYE